MKKTMFSLVAVVAISLLSFTAKAESIVYLVDNFYLKDLDQVTFNGDVIPLKPKEVQKEKMGITYYKHTVTKVIVKNDGPLLIVKDHTWYEKPYHDEISLDLNDGDVYYIDLVSGLKSKIKVMSKKDGEKALKNATTKKDWKLEEDIIYEN